MFVEGRCPRYLVKSAPVPAECLQRRISLSLLVSCLAGCHVWCCQWGLCAVGTLTATKQCGTVTKGKMMRPPCTEVKSGAIWERPAMLVSTHSPPAPKAASTGKFPSPQTSSCFRPGPTQLFSSNNCSHSCGVSRIEEYPSINNLCTGTFWGPEM